MPSANMIIQFRTRLLHSLAPIRDAAVWAAVRVPSPIYVAMLSRARAAIGGTVALMVLAILLPFSPGGVAGVFGSALAWTGGLALGATAIRASLLVRQVVDLEERLRVSELELNKRLNAEENLVLRKTRERIAISS